MIRSEKTRKFIIEKTAPIFNKKGYTGTYLSDLTNATGLSKGSIYGNFKDKNEVALECFKYNYRFQTEKIMALMAKEMSATKKLLAFLHHYTTEYQVIFDNGGCALLNTAVDADDGNETLKIAVTEKIANWVKKIESILNEGIQNGTVKPVNTLDFAHKMVALIEGSILLSKTLNNPDILTKNLNSLVRDVEKLSIK